MDARSSSALECRAHRVLLWRELAAALQKAQRAIVMADPKGMEAGLSAQHQLCLALIALGSVEREQLLPDANAAARARWSALTRELQTMQGRSQHLGRVQAALLRRSQRAQELMARLLATTAVTYVPPLIRATAAAGK